MANSKYTYDDFTKAASASGLMSDFDTDDLRNARANPDAAMTLLGYKKDYASAMRSGNDSAAYLAQDGINRIRAGYAPAAANEAGTPSLAMKPSQVLTSTSSAVPSSAPSSPSGSSFPYTARDAINVLRDQAGYDVGDVSGYDVNADSKVNVKDATYILRRLAGYSDESAQSAARDDAAVTPADYGTEYSRLLGEYLSGDVNVEGSDLWKSYAKSYAREGARAQESVLDQFAAANGGQLSSYAQSAASQQRNYYMSQLMDRYPEIYSQLRSEQADRLSAIMSAQELQRNDAVLAAQYGDFDALRELGIDPSRYLEEEEYQKRAQEALYAAQYGDYTLLDTLFGSGTAAAQEREKQLAALQVALGYGDASGFDKQYGTSVGDVLSEEKAFERSQAELDRAYTLAQLGLYDELAALTGRTAEEIRSAFTTASAASSSGTSSGGSGSSSASSSILKSIPSEVKSIAKELSGDNYALAEKLNALITDGTLTEEQGDYLYSLYAKQYTTRDQAIKAGAPEDTWSEEAFHYAKTSAGSNAYSYLPDTYPEYLNYMVAKGNGKI